MKERLRYPCTGHTSSDGFAEFLGHELGKSRHNLNAFAAELHKTIGPERITLTNSGSSANLAAAFALRELCSGTHKPHAVVAGFTFPTTVAALLTAGFTVSVADTDGFALSPVALQRALRPETKLVCVTHFLGFAAPLPALAEICRAHGAFLLQDACEALRLSSGGKRVDEWGTLTTWSFYHPHHLSAYGGGAVLARDEHVQRVVESVTHWGRECSCHAPGLPCEAPDNADHQFSYTRRGFNLEMSELNACFGRFALRRFHDDERKRHAHYRTLYDCLSDLESVAVTKAVPDDGSPFVFPIVLREQVRDTRNEVVAKLAARGVECRSLMGGAIVRHPAYAQLEHDGLRQCRALSDRAFFVGVHQTLPADDVAAVGGILREVLA